MPEIVVAELRWVQWTVEHIAVHGVTVEEVEAIVYGAPLVQEGHSGRDILIGPVGGRLLRVVLAPEPDNVFFVVTAHPARDKDRRLYQEERGPLT